MKDALILGGGIAGLTAGWILQAEGLDVTVLEKSPTPGGPIASLRKDGYLVERGPNSLLLPDPWVESWIELIGLGSELVETNPAASKRYIIKRGRPIAAPMSPWQAVSTPLFSLRAKLGFLAEPFRKRIEDTQGATETVASFVTRRMGREFLDYAIDPFVSGIYAGDPHQLIVEHAFPLMRSFEKDGGSIVRGALRFRKRKRAEGSPFKKRSVSFRNGLGALPTALGAGLGARLQLDATAIAVSQVDGGWHAKWIQRGRHCEGAARHLLVCLPSFAVKAIAWPDHIASAIRTAPNLHYPAVHSLALGFRRSQIQHPLDGFGMLAPSVEDLTILGALFSSSLFPGRAPPDHCLLTVMLGGIRRPDLAVATQERLTELALADLKPLLGLSGDPTFHHLSSWPKAIPQYNANFGPWRDTLTELESRHSGLRFGGNAIDGIAMGASIMSGRRLAQATLAGRAR